MAEAGGTGSGFSLNGDDLRKMIIAAWKHFQKYKQVINDLNVFPVPDGDTGTNMELTIAAAAAGAQKTPTTAVGPVAEAVAMSALMGARGNSGVILSQLLRGLARGLGDKNDASSAEMSRAFQYGVVYAYRAVSKPVEGTILTVAREMARGSREALRRPVPFSEIIKSAIASGGKALARTPDLLPVLKQAGVVDAGGKGLLVFLEGCLKGLEGSTEIEEEIPTSALGQGTNVGMQEAVSLTFCYCTEMIIKGRHIDIPQLRAALNEMGDSLVLVEAGGIAKVHVHTNHPGQVLEICLREGTLHDMKIDNMLEQHRQQSVTEPDGQGSDEGRTEKPIGLISVTFGQGLTEILKSFGVDEVVGESSGVAPGVEDFVQAIRRVPASKVVILPNNPNICMPAEQAKNLVSKEVAVIPSRTLPEGIAAALAFNPSASLEENVKTMSERAGRVKTGEITYAIRDVQINSLVVSKGAVIGLYGGNIVTAGEQVLEVALELVERMVGTEDEVVTLYYGAKVSSEEANTLCNRIKKKLPTMEAEAYPGGQELYYYYISVE
ncbi:MAG: DAK2 domain-containing protein [Bacillota bacterium]